MPGSALSEQRRLGAGVLPRPAWGDQRRLFAGYFGAVGGAGHACGTSVAYGLFLCVRMCPNERDPQNGWCLFGPVLVLYKHSSLETCSTFVKINFVVDASYVWRFCLGPVLQGSGPWVCLPGMAKWDLTAGSLQTENGLPGPGGQVPC